MCQKYIFLLIVERVPNITPILKLLCWLPVEHRLFYRDAVLAFKCMTHGCAPLYLTFHIGLPSQIRYHNNVRFCR